MSTSVTSLWTWRRLVTRARALFEPARAPAKIFIKPPKFCDHLGEIFIHTLNAHRIIIMTDHTKVLIDINCMKMWVKTAIIINNIFKSKTSLLVFLSEWVKSRVHFEVETSLKLVSTVAILCREHIKMEKNVWLRTDFKRSNTMIFHVQTLKKLLVRMHSEGYSSCLVCLCVCVCECMCVYVRLLPLFQ